MFQLDCHILKKAFEENPPKEEIVRLYDNQNEITELGISPISIVEEMAKKIRYKFYIERNLYQSAEDVSNPRE